MTQPPLHSLSYTRLNGETRQMADFAGKVLLIVNTASACGYTPQYAALEALHREFQAAGLVVLGFPCNQFGAQEPGSAQEIGAFCAANYGVSFELADKLDVNGAAAHPLFEWLKAEAPGVFGSEAIKWNFTKFLVDRSGRCVSRHAPSTAPEALRGEIEALLAAPA